MFQIGEQRGDRLVGLAGELAVVSLDVHVTVPRALVFHPAAVNLHKADTALDETPRHEALLCKVRALLVVDAVEAADVLRLPRDFERVGRGHLHPVGEFKTLDARAQLGVGRRLFEVMLVEPLHQIELRALLGVGHVRVALHVVDRRALRIERGALKHAGQECGTPVRRLPLG